MTHMADPPPSSEWPPTGGHSSSHPIIWGGRVETIHVFDDPCMRGARHLGWCWYVNDKIKFKPDDL